MLVRLSVCTADIRKTYSIENVICPCAGAHKKPVFMTGMNNPIALTDYSCLPCQRTLTSSLHKGMMKTFPVSTSLETDRKTIGAVASVHSEPMRTEIIRRIINKEFITMKKRVVSMVLVMLLLCSMLSISALADNEPTVTVYFTSTMFTDGGYDFVNETPILQHYDSTKNPANNPFANNFGCQVISISEINTYVTAARAVYNAPSTFTGNPNVLDAIYTGLVKMGRSPYGGWDPTVYPNKPCGGYITGFNSDGNPQYGPSSSYEDGDGNIYDIYTGYGWQIACTQSGTVTECNYYGTNYPLFDGMVIVFDYSHYTIYYPRS